MQMVLALIVAVAAVAAVVAVAQIGRLAAKWPLAVSELRYINAQATHQALLMGVAALVLLALHALNPLNFSLFVAPGAPAAPAQGVRWMAIPEGESWVHIGAGLWASVVVLTVVPVALQIRKSGATLTRLVRYLPWVVLFALSNSFAEEVVYRLSVIVGLTGSIGPSYVLALSAAAFGAPHLRRLPVGLFVALASGLLGWMLAKSVVDTHGIFWAGLVHFSQDLVVIAACVVASAHESPTGDGVDAAPGADRLAVTTASRRAP